MRNGLNARYRCFQLGIMRFFLIIPLYGVALEVLVPPQECAFSREGKTFSTEKSVAVTDA